MMITIILYKYIYVYIYHIYKIIKLFFIGKMYYVLLIVYIISISGYLTSIFQYMLLYGQCCAQSRLLNWLQSDRWNSFLNLTFVGNNAIAQLHIQTSNINNYLACCNWLYRLTIKRILLYQTCACNSHLPLCKILYHFQTPNNNVPFYLIDIWSLNVFAWNNS